MTQLENWRFHSIRLFNVKLELILALGILLSFFLPMSMNLGCEPLDFCFIDFSELFNNILAFSFGTKPQLPHVGYAFLEAYQEIKQDFSEGKFRILFFYVFIFLGPILGFFVRQIKLHQLVLFLASMMIFLITLIAAFIAIISIPHNAFKDEVLAGYYFFVSVYSIYLCLFLFELLLQIFSGLKKVAVYLHNRIRKQEV